MRKTFTDQLNSFMPRYRGALRLCPEDVYGVFPRHTRETSRNQGGNNISVWEDYWVMYRAARVRRWSGCWAEEMNEKGGRAERMFSSVMKGRWPEARSCLASPAAQPPSTAIASR